MAGLGTLSYDDPTTKPPDTSAWGVPVGLGASGAPAGSSGLASVATPGMTPSYEGPSFASDTTPAPAPTTPAPQTPDGGWATQAGSTGPQTAPPSFDFEGTLAQLQTEQDATKRETLRDQLARNVSQTLSGQGHDVKWQGSVLMVDGRPYVVGQSDAAQKQLQTAVDQRSMLSPSSVLPGEHDPTAGAGTAGSGSSGQHYLGAYSGANDGFDVAKVADPTKGTTFKYAAARVFDQFDPKTFRSNPQPVLDALRAAGLNPRLVGDDKIDFGTGDGPIDVLKGDNTWWWGAEAPGKVGTVGGSVMSTSGGLYAPGYGPGGAAGAPSYASDTATGGGVTAPVDAASVTGGWKPSSGNYTPGEIPTSDVPSFSYDKILSDILSTGPTNAEEEKFMQDLLAHPESMPPEMVATLQAKQKDELAAQAQRDDEEMRQFGGSAGIGDSRWLASERNAAQRARDVAITNSNRDISIEAAKTNMADRLKAAEAATSYNTMRGNQKATAVSTATRAALDSSAALGDRMKLREDVKSRAAELKISEDKVMTDYVGTLLDTALRNRSIDSSERTTIMELAQKDRQFAEDVSIRLAQIEQAERQFAANYGLAFQTTQHNIDQDMWLRDPANRTATP